MADYRQIHTHIWKDGWFLDLSADDKLLFIYLFSNERTSVAGIYELAPRVMAFETGLEQAAITKALQRFSQAGKVHYANGILWIVNMRKYNANPSPRVHDRICSDLAKIPDSQLKRRYIEYYDPAAAIPYVPDTVSIPYQPVSTEQEQEQEQEKEQEHIGADAPPPLPKVPAEELTPAQKLFMERWNSKRLNAEQKTAIKEMETQYGLQRVTDGVVWAREKNMALGQSIGSIRTALKNWGAHKPAANGNGHAKDPAANLKAAMALEAERAKSR
jgi:hypothetical protein